MKNKDKDKKKDDFEALRRSRIKLEKAIEKEEKSLFPDRELIGFSRAILWLFGGDDDKKKD